MSVLEGVGGAARTAVRSLKPHTGCDGSKIAAPQLMMLNRPPRPRSKAQKAAASVGLCTANSSAPLAPSEVPQFDSARKSWREMRRKRKRGQSVDEGTVLLVLEAYFSDITGHEAATHPWRLQHAESVSGLSLKTVRKIVHHYLESHELLIEDVSKRGVGAESYPGYSLPEGIQEDVVAWVQTELNHDLGPQWVTLQGLQQHILDVFDIRMSRTRICKLAKIWGLEWGEVTKTPKGQCSPERKMLRQVYVLHLAAAIKRGDIVVFTDQSFSNVNSHSNMSFHPSGAPHAQNAPTGVGARLCWIQAFDKSGFLCQYYDIPEGEEDDPEYRFGGVVLPALGDITTSCPTAEMMFAAKEGGSTGDYHGNFDHVIVMSWIRLRLIPALQARYPEWFKWHQSQSDRKRQSANTAAPLTNFEETCGDICCL